MIETHCYSEITFKIVTTILRLPEISNTHVIIVGSHLDWTALSNNETFEILRNSNMLSFPCYSMDDILELLLKVRPISESEPIFWIKFINLFVNSVIRVTMNLKDIKSACLSLFKQFCEPILKSRVKRSQFMHLQTIASIKNYFDQALKSIGKTIIFNVKYSKSYQDLRLSLLKKCLLLAAYLASSNPLKLENLKRKYLERKTSIIKKVLIQKIHKKKKKIFCRNEMLFILRLLLELRLTNTSCQSNRISEIKHVKSIAFSVNVFYEIANLEKLRLLIKIPMKNTCMDHEVNYYCTLSHNFAKKLAGNMDLKF